jgi:subtilisin-like proprotein convertase family protein
VYSRFVAIVALMFVVAACTSSPIASVTSVSVDQGSLSLFVGNSATLTATVVAVGSASQAVTWSISPVGVATVDATTGEVVAVAPGDAVITATSTFDATKSDTVEVSVQLAPNVTSVSIDQGAFSLFVGDSATLTATVVAVGGASQAVTWSISPAGVAAVDAATGEVVAVAPGDAVITATSTFDATKSDTVELNVPPVTATFDQSGPITIPLSGVANPYPSEIVVAGMPPTLLRVTVTLVGMNHTFTDDLDVLLVGPGGEATILMSDVGGGTDLVDVTLTFDMDASESLPDSTQVISGTYLPTNFDAGGAVDTFAAPAPAGPYVATLDVFTGVDPNGAWSLFVVDDLGGDQGSIAGGWSITITSE